MARAGGTAGGGMGGGPDSAPGGSSAAGPGTDGPGNAPGEGMDADAFGGGGDPSQQTSKEFEAAFKQALRNLEAGSNRQAVAPSQESTTGTATAPAAPKGAEDDADNIGRTMQEKGAFLDDREAIDGAASPSAVGVSLDDPQGTEEGLAQAAQANFQEKTGFDPEKEAFREKERRSMGVTRARDAYTGAKSSFDNVEPIDQYGRVPSIEKKFATDPIGKKAAYDALREYAKANIESRTTLGKAIQAIVSLLGPMSLTNNIGKVMDMAFTKAGFTTDSQLNSIGLAIRSGQEVSTQGARGAGGVSVGSIDDGGGAFLEYVEPWMRGLSDQQIDYYLDRPSELEWVRTTWSKAFGMPSKYSQE